MHRSSVEEVSDSVFGLAETVAVKGIVRPAALFSAAYDSGFTQNLHMMRERGLADIELFEQNAGAQLPAGKPVKDLQPVCVTQRFK